jgi:butyryl-CoA dehydrogenase
MNLDLTEAQQLVQQKARDFAGRELEPVAAEIDRSARWPAEIVVRLAELGFLGIAVPADHGGAGLDRVSQALVVEELSAACAGSGAIVTAANALFGDVLAAFGSAWQKRDVLEPAAAGAKLGCFALKESDASRPTVAVKQSDGSFVLDGAKSFVTLGPEAAHTIVLARTGDDAHYTALLVPRGAPGFTVGPRDEKLGLRAAVSCSLSFEGVRVPADHVIGVEGGGLAVAMAALDGGRIGVAAQAIGVARAALEKAAAYVRERRGAPGSKSAPLANLQAVQFLIADMAVDVDAARLLTLRAAALADAGARHSAESAMAKLFAAEAATRVTHRAMTILGSAALAPGPGLERHYRDARVTEIDAGTSETQRALVAALAVWPEGQRPGSTPAVAGILEG